MIRWLVHLCFVDFATDEELDLWLEDEPYVTNRVWNMDEIQIVPVKLLPKTNN